MGPTCNKHSRVPYDPELPENWTLARLKEELRRKKIDFSNNERQMALVQLLKGSTVFHSEDQVTEGESVTSQFDSA